jgi:phosphate transport system permease protein
MKFHMDGPETLFLSCTVVTALFTLLILGFILLTAAPVLQKEGIGFFTGTSWDYTNQHFGILNFLVSTLVMTAMTMVIAVPLGLLTAVFLAEWAPAWLDKSISSMIELLVGIPSVVFGIFGLFVLKDIFRNTINPTISATLGFIPIFHDSNSMGIGLLLAATVLAIMVLPTITALSRDAIRGVPQEYREASYAVGATKWETIKMIVVPAALSGIITGIILALMRAMGETMAVVMLVGCVAQVPDSIYSLTYPMTSKIINDIGYHMATDMDRSALFAIGAVLFAMEMGFVAAIRIVTKYLSLGR